MPPCLCVFRARQGGLWGGFRALGQGHTFGLLQRAAVLLLACGGEPEQQGRAALH